jgi:hypothetical protein
MSGGEKQRSTALSPHDFVILDHWGRQLYDAFNARPYLVGSVARAAKDWRDVDVRILLPDDAGWLIEFPDMEGAIQSIRLRTINMAVTLWGRRVTGLPIDFQFQPESEWRSYGDERRAALGISLKYTAQEAWDRRADAIASVLDPDGASGSEAESK